MSVEHLGAVQFEIKARSHVVFSDQPEENGGFDEGVTPAELLLASLGSCAAYYAVQYLRSRQLATEGTRAVVSAEQAKNPARMDKIRIEIRAPEGVGAEHERGLQRAVNQCLIHNTLLHPPTISTVVISGETAAA